MVFALGGCINHVSYDFRRDDHQCQSSRDCSIFPDLTFAGLLKLVKAVMIELKRLLKAVWEAIETGLGSIMLPSGLPCKTLKMLGIPCSLGAIKITIPDLIKAMVMFVVAVVKTIAKAVKKLIEFIKIVGGGGLFLARKMGSWGRLFLVISSTFWSQLGRTRFICNKSPLGA